MPRFVERIILRKKKTVIALSSIIFPRKKIKKIQLHSRTEFRENGTDQDIFERLFSILLQNCILGVFYLTKEIKFFSTFFLFFSFDKKMTNF